MNEFKSVFSSLLTNHPEYNKLGMTLKAIALETLLYKVAELQEEDGYIYGGMKCFKLKINALVYEFELTAKVPK